MQRWFLELLACPHCRGNLCPDKTGPDTVRDAARELVCIGCGVRFPISRSIPRFVSTSDYADSFSFQWLRFRTTQLDSAHRRGESEARFRQSLNFLLAELSGQLVLDAGCGMGRFAEIALKYGARVVAVDMSLAVEAAYENLKQYSLVQFVQADILHLPFREEAFDFIYSLGVLHHTPDPKGAFHALVKLLKPGGKISVTVYSGYNPVYMRATNFWRPLFAKLPKWLVYYLAHAAIPLYYLYRLPILGPVFQAVFPISMHPDKEWRVLDTFDCYTPLFQSYHTHYEVFQWLKEIGLKDIEALEPGISFIATR